jgi:hypothetical protein
LVKHPSLKSLALMACELRPQEVKLLAELKTLQWLWCHSCRGIAEADLEALRRARPDVTVLK